MAQDGGAATLPFRLSAAGMTDIGRGRDHNEDAVLLRPDLHLYVVADGAGGHNAGNVASALATTSLAEFFESTEPNFAEAPDVDAFGMLTAARRLATGIQRVNKDIVEIAKASQRYKGMGSTIVAVAMSPRLAIMHVAHVGDSRCYRFRAGQLELLTHDHSLLNDVLELKPDVDDATLARLPRNVVTRALGMDEEVRVSMRSFPVLPGDRVLLCSDGLTDALEPERIWQVMALEHKSPEELTQLLIELANEAGADDNIAVAVLSCEMAPPPAVLHKRRTTSARQQRMETIVDPTEHTPLTFADSFSFDEGDAEGGSDTAVMDSPPRYEGSSPEIIIVGPDGPEVVPQQKDTPSLRDALEDAFDAIFKRE